MSYRPTGTGLVQLHWQDAADPARTRLVAQGGPFADVDAFQAWASDVLRERQHERPEGWCPLVCDSTSSHFVRPAGREQQA